MSKEQKAKQGPHISPFEAIRKETEEGIETGLHETWQRYLSTMTIATFSKS